MSDWEQWGNSPEDTWGESSKMRKWRFGGRNGMEQVMLLTFIRWYRHTHTCICWLSNKPICSKWGHHLFATHNNPHVTAFFSFPFQTLFFHAVTLSPLPNSWSNQCLCMLMKGKMFFSKFIIFQKIYRPLPGTGQYIESHILKLSNATESWIPPPGGINTAEERLCTPTDLCCFRTSLRKMQECTH